MTQEAGESLEMLIVHSTLAKCTPKPPCPAAMGDRTPVAMPDGLFPDREVCDLFCLALRRKK